MVPPFRIPMVLCTLVLTLTIFLPAFAGSPVDGVAATVYFSPHGGAAEAIIEAIGQERTTVLVQMYTFTNAPIAAALAQARKRGVPVYVILDKSQRTEKYSVADHLVRSGIPTYIDEQHAMQHAKTYCLIGSATVITGSANATTAATDLNVENTLVLRSKALLAQYVQHWKAIVGRSQPYPGRR